MGVKPGGVGTVLVDVEVVVVILTDVSVLVNVSVEVTVFVPMKCQSRRTGERWQGVYLL